MVEIFTINIFFAFKKGGSQQNQGVGEGFDKSPFSVL